MSMRASRLPLLPRLSMSARRALAGVLGGVGVGWVSAGLLAFGAVLLSRPAQASIVMALDLPDLVQQADHIALVDVLSQHADWDSKHERILSTIELKVVERWKGRGAPASGVPSDRITVIQAGGTVGDE